MRKQVVDNMARDAGEAKSKAREDDWLDLEALAEAEITSEDPAHPLEAALSAGGSSDEGWRATASGEQTIRLRFSEPRKIRRIQLEFVETTIARTQELVLRWSADMGRTYREIVRQQWNFDPQGASVELEDYRVELEGVTVLELDIVPDISRGDALATLAAWRVA